MSEVASSRCVTIALRFRNATRRFDRTHQEVPTGFSEPPFFSGVYQLGCLKHLLGAARLGLVNRDAGVLPEQRAGGLEQDPEVEENFNCGLALRTLTYGRKQGSPTW